jgi:hypothetical protein
MVSTSQSSKLFAGCPGFILHSLYTKILRMKPGFFCVFFCFFIVFAQAQKKALDPTVYDRWESIGERVLSPDGKWLVYTVTPQEGDARLVVRGIGTDYAREIPRGTEATITEDGKFVVFLIHPFFKDSREAKIRKRTPDQMPKDSLGWLEPGTDRLVKIPRVKSYRIAEKSGEWMAYLMEKPPHGSGC